MDEATLRARTQELLRRMGPLTPREIAARLSGGADAAAVPPPRELYRLLLDDPDPELDPSDPGAFQAFPLVDGRLVDLDDLVDGTVFTHVLTDDERAAGEVVATPDLAPLMLCSDDSLELPLHGHDTPARYLRDGRLAGPDGWLPDAPVLVARLRDGAVELAGADAVPEPDPTLAEHLAAVWDVLADRPYPADDVELVVEALARHPHMFDAARAPLGDLLAAAGIGVDGGRLVPLDEDGLPIADPDPVEMEADLRDHLVHDHGLDDDAVAAVFGVLDQLGALGDRAGRAARVTTPSSPASSTAWTWTPPPTTWGSCSAASTAPAPWPRTSPARTRSPRLCCWRCSTPLGAGCGARTCAPTATCCGRACSSSSATTTPRRNASCAGPSSSTTTRRPCSSSSASSPTGASRPRRWGCSGGWRARAWRPGPRRWNRGPAPVPCRPAATTRARAGRGASTRSAAPGTTAGPCRPASRWCGRRSSGSCCCRCPPTSSRTSPQPPAARRARRAWTTWRSPTCCCSRAGCSRTCATCAGRYYPPTSWRCCVTGPTCVPGCTRWWRSTPAAG